MAKHTKSVKYCLFLVASKIPVRALAQSADLLTLVCIPITCTSIHNSQLRLSRHPIRVNSCTFVEGLNIKLRSMAALRRAPATGWVAMASDHTAAVWQPPVRSCNSWGKSCYQLPRFLIVLTSIFVMISRQISVIIRVHPWTSSLIIRTILEKPRLPHLDLRADYENLNDRKAAIGLYFMLLLNFSLDIKANFISLNTLIPESRKTSNHKLLKLRS